jgi:hypothetical protein
MTWGHGPLSFCHTVSSWAPAKSPSLSYSWKASAVELVSFHLTGVDSVRRKSPAACFSFVPGPTRPLSLLGDRGKRHLARSVAAPWQWGRGVSDGQCWLNLYAQGS